MATLTSLRDEVGSEEGSDLQREIDENLATAPVLQPLKDRADRIIKNLEERKTTGLAAMDQLAALAAEKDAAMQAARNSGLSPRAFAIAWVLREDAAIKAVGIDPMTLAKDAEALLGRYRNSLMNADEQRRLRALAVHAPPCSWAGRAGACRRPRCTAVVGGGLRMKSSQYPAQDLKRRVLSWAVKLKVNPRAVRVQEMRKNGARALQRAPSR